MRRFGIEEPDLRRPDAGVVRQQFLNGAFAIRRRKAFDDQFRSGPDVGVLPSFCALPAARLGGLQRGRATVLSPARDDRYVDEAGWRRLWGYPRRR